MRVVRILCDERGEEPADVDEGEATTDAAGVGGVLVWALNQKRAEEEAAAAGAKS